MKKLSRGKWLIGMVIVLAIICTIVIKPWEKPVSKLIVIRNMDIDVDKEVYMLDKEDIYIKEIDTQLTFITYIKDLKEIQFGYKLNKRKGEKTFGYKFKLRDGEKVIADNFTVTPSSEIFYTHYRILMPADISTIDKLYLDIYDKHNELLSSILIMEDSKDFKKIDYNYTNGKYSFVEEK